MSFFLRADHPESQAFLLFGAEHFVLLFVLAICIAILLYLLKHMPPACAKYIIYAAAVIEPVLELSHSVWMYLTGTTEIVKLLPLHLCGLQSLFIPLAVFTKLTCFQDFVYASSLLGGIFGTVFPAGVARYYPLWSFQTLQTFALHGLLIFIPLALIRTNQHRPDPRRFPRVLCIFLLAVFIVGSVDRTFGENYMFLYAPPENTPLELIFDVFGRGIYLACAFVILAGISFVIHLPFRSPRPESSRAAAHDLSEPLIFVSGYLSRSERFRQKTIFQAWIKSHKQHHLFERQTDYSKREH